MKIVVSILSLCVVLLADFVRVNNAVTDTETGLTWQDDGNVTMKHIWTAAINYCESLELNGFQDWRLPNINELLSIVDRTKSEPAISTVFVNVGYELSDATFSSTTEHSGAFDGARSVRFVDGGSGPYPKNSSRFVRCVRGNANVTFTPTLDPTTVNYCKKNPDKCGIQCTKIVVIPF